ncbi:MAG TPA: YbdD/YjiX family protein [Gemmatimonadales bacterium]|nr:YbdD/YjiX family protein [Gemmatimonadales bacterium]
MTTPAVTRERGRRAPGLRERLRRLAGALRTIVGAPDYERYVAHVRERHPHCAPLGRAEFERERLEGRYSRPGARCC